MRASRTFRPAVDGLETRNLLSGGAVAPQADTGITYYLVGQGVKGRWSLGTMPEPNVYQTQLLAGDRTTHLEGEFLIGNGKFPGGFEAIVKSTSELSMPPLSTGGPAAGILQLTVTGRIGKKTETLNENLFVSGSVQTAKRSGYQEITGNLRFPSFSLAATRDSIGGGTIVFKEFVYKSEDSGTFDLNFEKPQAQP